MRQTTVLQRLLGGGPTPGLAEFKLQQPQAGLGWTLHVCQARRAGPWDFTVAGQPSRTATSVQVSTTGFMSDRSQGLPSGGSPPGHESNARLTRVSPTGSEARQWFSSYTGRRQQRRAARQHQFRSAPRGSCQIAVRDCHRAGARRATSAGLTRVKTAGPEAGQWFSSYTGRHQQRGALTVMEAASLQSTGTVIIKSANGYNNNLSVQSSDCQPPTNGYNNC